MAWLKRLIVELVIVVLLILPAQQKEAAKVSILRFSIWPGQLPHTIPDPIILSDNESVGAKSETDYNDLDVDLKAKSDSNSTHVIEREPADDGGFGSRTTHTSSRLVTNHTDDGNNNGVADDTQLQLPADRPGSASPSHRTVTQHASKLQVNTEITQGSASYVDLDVTKEVDDDDADTRSTKRSRSSAVSRNNPAFNSNVSVAKRQDGQHDSAQSQQLGPAKASL